MIYKNKIMRLVSVVLIVIFVLQTAGCGFFQRLFGQEGEGVITPPPTEGGGNILTGTAKGPSGFAMGIATSPNGGAGTASFSLEVPYGAKSLTVGASDEKANPNLEGVQVILKAPDGKVMAAMANGTVDDSALNQVPSPSQELENALGEWAENTLGLTSNLSDEQLDAEIDEFLGKPLSEQTLDENTQSLLDSYLNEVASIPNAGRGAGRETGSTPKNKLVVLNPTAGLWRVELNSSLSAQQFEIKTVVVPQKGLPSPEEVEQVSQQLSLKYGGRFFESATFKETVRFLLHAAIWAAVEVLLHYGIKKAAAIAAAKAFAAFPGEVASRLVIAAIAYSTTHYALSKVKALLHLGVHLAVYKAVNAATDKICGWLAKVSGNYRLRKRA